MSYVLNRDDIISFAKFINARTKQQGEELIFEYCPACNGGGKDKETFSINTENGAFNCLRSSCGYHGHFVELARDFGFELEFRMPTIYRQLEQPKSPIVSADTAIEYLKGRGIEPDITKRYEITSHKSKPDIIVFPFFDERGVLQCIKYRNAKFVKGKSQGGKEWFEKDTMPIIYGMKQANDFTKPLIITEGQIDALSIAQSGYANACSVPGGAKGFTFFPICREWLEKFPCVIVFGDYENGKITLVDDFKSRLSKPIKVVRKKDYLGEKDANDILRKYGTRAIQIAVENACEPAIDNLKDISTVASIDINELDKIPTGIDDLDRALGGGICMGQVMLLTGKRGEGKSTLLSAFCANALNEYSNVFIYSGELAAFHVKRWLDFQLAGSAHITSVTNKYGDDQYSISDDVERRINDWYRGRAFIYDNDYIPDGKGEMETLPETIEKAIRTYGTKLICIDNLMTAMDYVGGKDDLYTAQSAFVGKLKKIAMKYQVVVILVAHPRKQIGDLGNDDVSGSADITNKVDVVLSYGRDPMGDGSQAKLQILKNRLFGRLRVGEDSIKLLYSMKSKRIVSAMSRDMTPKIYGWENSYAIKELPKEPEVNDELPF